MKQRYAGRGFIAADIQLSSRLPYFRGCNSNRIGTTPPGPVISQAAMRFAPSPYITSNVCRVMFHGVSMDVEKLNAIPYSLRKEFILR